MNGRGSHVARPQPPARGRHAGISAAARSAGRASGPYDPAPTQETRPQASLVARLPELILAGAWRWRWRLAPVYLGCGTAVGAAAAPVWTIGGLSVSAAAAELAARTQVRGPGGRMFLSARERRMAAAGLATAAAWTGATMVPGLAWWADAGLLAGGLGVQSRAWWASRRPRPEPEPEPASTLSPLAQALLDGWVNEICVGQGPRVLRGSWPVEDGVKEPAEGTVVMRVQLAHGVHAKQALSGLTRQAVEALFALPQDTVRLEPVREKSTQVDVVFTPARRLEREGGVPWPGPVLYDSGLVPVAEADTGADVHIPLYTDTRIRHGFISGTTGAGKSVSSVSVMLPGLKAGIEVCLLVDGKRGTSTPYLRSVVSRYARTEQQWLILIEIAYRVMKAREERRGAAGLHEWRTPEETDPIVTLIIDDTTAVNRVIKTKHVEMICELLEHGQAVGVRVIQITQSPAAEHIIGGVPARNLMTSGGWAICHRAGGTGANRLTLDSTNVDVTLKGLPNGQAAITVEGQLVGYPAQVRNATKDRVLEEISGIQVRHLEGADLAAAGSDYLADHWNAGWTIPTPATGAGVAPPAQVPHQRHVGSVTGTGVSGPAPSSPDPAAGDGMYEIIAADGQGRSVTSVIDAATVDQLARNLAGSSGDGTISVETAKALLLSSGTIRPLVRDTIAGLDGNDETSPDEEDLPESRLWVLDRLAALPQGATLGQLQDAADGDDSAPSRRTISNALADLMTRGAVTKHGAVWTRIEPAGDEVVDGAE